MRTITFYSYKGGTGRTLLLANVAKFLAWCGKTVAILDLDLEAPGLHFKFGKQDQPLELRHERGLVDYLAAWQSKLDDPEEDLSEYFETISLGGYPVETYLLPAGDAPSESYAARLTQLNWQQLLYQQGNIPLAQRLGSRALLKIKDFARVEKSADYLLIDSRTGITDIGGVAINVLADTVVCTMLSNPENFAGISQVVKNLDSKNASGPSTVEYLVLLSRLDEGNRLLDDHEETILKEYARKLSIPFPSAGVGEKKPGQLGLAVLHRDYALEIKESLRFDGEVTPNESLLSRDYVHVFDALGLLKEVPPGRKERLKTIASEPKGADLKRAEEDLLSRIGRGHFADSPRHPWAWSSTRVASRPQRALIYLPPSDHLQSTSFGRFMESVVKHLGNEVDGTVLSKEIQDDFWARFVTSGILEGEFEFCGEPLCHTWLRSHIVGIVQYGWMKNFTLLVSGSSPLVETLRPILREISSSRPSSNEIRSQEPAIARVIKYLQGENVRFRIGVVGVGAASAECMRHLTTIVADPQNLQRKGSAQELRKWMEDSPETALAVCDVNLALSIDRAYSRPARSRNDYRKTDESDRRPATSKRIRYGKSDPEYFLPFSHPVPVGIPYAAGDRGWRRLIAKAFLRTLEETSEKWGEGKSSWEGDLKQELEHAGIEPLGESQLRRQLFLDLTFHDVLHHENHHQQTKLLQTGGSEK